MDSGTNDTSQQDHTPPPDRLLKPWRDSERQFLANWEVTDGDHMIIIVLGPTIPNRYAQLAVTEALPTALKALYQCCDSQPGQIRLNDTLIVHVLADHPNNPHLLAEAIAGTIRTRLAEFPCVGVAAAASQVDVSETCALPAASRARAASWFALQQAI